MNGRPELGGSCHGKKELNRDGRRVVGGAWRELEGLGLEEGLNADDAKSAQTTMPGHSDAETPQRGPFPTPSAFDPNEMTNGERLR